MSKLRDPDEIFYKSVHTDHLRSPWHTPGGWRRQHELDIAGHFEFYSVRKIDSSLWILPNTGFILNMSWIKKQYYAVPNFLSSV